ncbi:transglutaminase family protein [Methylomagnum sp.]
MSSTRIALTHTIERRHAQRVLLPTHWLRLRPAPHTQADITAFSIKVGTEPHFLNWVRDPFENYLARLDLPEPVSGLAMTVDLVADLTPVNPFDFLTEPYAANFPFKYPDQLRKELKPYLHIPEPGPRLTAFLKTLDRKPAYIVGKLGNIAAEAHRNLAISGHASPGAVDLEAVLEQGHGSPWEAAWLLTLGMRSLGLAARFTSGYRVFLAPEPVVHAWSDVAESSATRWLDTATLHAWSEVFIPGAGWIGLDPAAGLFTHEGYIPLAATPDPLRALPWVAEAGESSESEVPAEAGTTSEVRVRRLVPAPAPAPYTDAQWADINVVGKQVDQRLKDEGMSLAMASTVCFTAADSTAPEWSTAAVGPGKRAAAEELLTRLRQRLAPGGVPHEGQGEWFGGENLPRWKLNCFFRTDGQPITHHPALQNKTDAAFKTTSVSASTVSPLPQAGHPRRAVKTMNVGPEAPEISDAANFAQTLAKRLGVSPDYLLPAHEDQLHELWLNRHHIQFEPPAEALRDPIRRRALAIKLSQTRLDPVGYVLPLRWDAASERWATGRWRFRRGALYLAPGNSPLGYRLPLDSLPMGEDAPANPDPERCHFEERPLLAEIHGEPAARLTRHPQVAEPLESADLDQPLARPPRTALCVQVREGRLHVFLPPLTHLEHWLDLVGVVEAAAAELGLPALLEGYEPPEDFRLGRLTLEPESGVLRVTLPAAESWARLSSIVSGVYREAEAVGLRAERIASDGRRQPPGGNADIVLGGERPPLSPFLLRPQLLHSLITYWQRHPCLSYFFAGRLLGPSGPAPRPDEGRDDALYELGLALSRLSLNDSPGPWIPDRALRHLLADPSGDMRRAEIRIDQLYAPDRSSLRLGRIALRSFESAPDAKLALAQGLLVRALLAYLAKAPVDAGLADWGGDLHDRFMLPGPLWEDLRKILGDLRGAGLPVQAEWFEPFLAQRFPVLGQIQMGDVGLELRLAHEPWPVLSEEVTASGVARLIDSSNQRIQAEVSGLIPSRHVLVCNGRRVPLHASRTRGLALAGVRYKTWNPPSTLHPTVPPIHSLVFDLLDARTGDVLGGCTYFPARPGLAGTLAAPVAVPELELEAEGGGEPRQPCPHPMAPPPWSPSGRFLNFGSGARRVAVPPEETGGRFPYLLDFVRAGG